jgi:hypothetical protein
VSKKIESATPMTAARPSGRAEPAEPSEGPMVEVDAGVTLGVAVAARTPPLGLDEADCVGLDEADCVGLDEADCVGLDEADCVGLDEADCVGLDEADCVGLGLLVAVWFVMLAEQMANAPPPLAEPLHWLILTA